MFIEQQLTRPSLSDLFRCNPKNVEDLDHYFRDCIHHFLVKCHFRVYLEPLEKCPYSLEHLKKSILARVNIPCGLKYDNYKGPSEGIKEDTHRKEDTNSSKDHFRWRKYL